MDNTAELSHEQRLFRHICCDTPHALRRVDIVHNRVSVSAATEGELRIWEESQMGGFRRFALDLSEWTNADMRKFALLLRGPTTFFVRIHADNAQFFPSRTALI